MLLVKTSPTYFCSLLLLLLLTPAVGYTATTFQQLNITVTQKGSGTVFPSGKVPVTLGENKLFNFQPNAGYEVSTVKVDGKLVSPTPVGSYTVAITKSHTLSVAFAKKTVEIHLLNQSLQMGSLQPAGSLIKVLYDGSKTFTAKPKKGYLAILRLDGNEVKRGGVNEQISYKLENIITSHSIDVHYEAEHNDAAIATVHINAKDPNGLTLHYRWKVSEGEIENTNTDTVQWVLPIGPGVHFANVLVSNDHGGYAARRIAVISDNLGTSSPAIQATGKDFEPVPAFGKTYAYNSVFNVIDATDYAQQKLLTRFVYLRDFIVPDPDATLNGLSGDSQGRFIATYLSQYYGGGDLFDPFSSLTTHPHTDANPAEYIVGSVRLADGSLCGIDDKFHGVDVAATATALDKDGKALPGTVKVKANAYGDYALLWKAEATQVLVECEDASIIVPIDIDRLAAKAVLANTGQPIIIPIAASMTAKINKRDVGIFLPPELKQPSDIHTSGDKFLGFKGMDTQLEACEYYKSIGAVQNCDRQGNPNGAITFDDWKRKVQMEPYSTQAGKEVDATYVNRIDLGLTRRHHAISYDDQPGLVSISAGDGISCGIRADESVVCWGSNDYGLTSPPAGRFSQVSAGSNHVCAIKSNDSTVVCWGDNSSGQAQYPAGSFNQIAAGANYTCGIKMADNSVACWGEWAPMSPTSESFTQVSAGGSHVCGIKTDGKLACWGNIDQAVIPDGQFSQVSVGDWQTCAIKSKDGTVACWGNVDLTTIKTETIHNSSSQFEFYKCADKFDGSGSTCWVQNPPPEGNFKQVSVGTYHACGLTINDTLVCWGDNEGGPGQSSPPAGNFSQVDVGSFNGCAIKADGAAACWGDNALAQSSPPNYKRRVAAYVCNHLGPKNSTRGALEWAITNALNDRNQVACVAMDFQSHNGGNPYVRFYVFNANGQLNLSINLDGRQEKYVPGTCVACHGGDKYDGHFPGDGSGSPDVGAHFLPYDVGNFLFSNRPGLTKAAQQAAIHQLNNIVLQTNATPIERTLINSWYKSGSDILDEHYWPEDWQKAAKDPEVLKLYPYPEVDIEHVYKDVNARYCRTCHVALNRDGMGAGRAFDNPEHFEIWSNIMHNEKYDNNGNLISSVPYVATHNDALPLTVCGDTPFLHDNHTMPNSLVTFNLLWNDKKAVKLLQDMLGKQIQGQEQGCKADTPDPELGVRK